MLQQTLRTKVHLLQAPRITRLFHSSKIYRSQIRTFRSSTRKLPLTALIAKTLTTLGLNTNEFTDIFATKIDKLKADVDGLKGDVNTLKQDVSALKTDIKELRHNMKEQLARCVLNQEKLFSQHALNQEKLFSQHAFNQERLFSQLTLNQGEQLSQLYWRSFFGVSLTFIYHILVSNEVKVLGIAILFIGSSWILPMVESNRLDDEIMRRRIAMMCVDRT